MDEDSKTQIPYNEFKKVIKNIYSKEWQWWWEDNSQNKLFTIQPKLGEGRPTFRKFQSEELILARLRSGHTKLTPS